MAQQQQHISAGDSWQNLKYDPVTYETDLRQSTQPLRYHLDPIYANPSGQVCRPADVGYIGRVGASIDKNYSLIDTDSELKLLNYRASKAPQHQYFPKCGQSKCDTGYPGPDAGGIQFDVPEQDKCRNPSDKWHFPECPKLRSEYTRVTYPVCDLKGTGVNRFQPICLDPQHPSRWEMPSEIGINYRMVVKDNHRPCIPKPMDQHAALPKPLTAKGVPAKEDDGVNGLPQRKVTMTYCTVGDADYGHKFFCNTKHV
jgi:hypothetical protein